MPIAPIVEHTLSLSSGIDVRYVAVGPTSATSATSIVLIRGWPDSWRSFERVIDALPPSARAIAVSLRGLGGSDAPEFGYDIGDFAGDVIEVIERLGVTTAVCVGHSMGCLVAQRIAVDRPDLVAGIVLLGGFSELCPELIDEISAVEGRSRPWTP